MLCRQSSDRHESFVQYTEENSSVLPGDASNTSPILTIYDNSFEQEGYSASFLHEIENFCDEQAFQLNFMK